MNVSTLIPSIALGSILALSITPNTVFAKNNSEAPVVGNLPVSTLDTAPAKGYIVAETNIIEMIAASEQHNVLTYALGRAGLASDLALEGPFTVFAPVDSAFEDLNSEESSAFITGEDKAQIGMLLETHVVSGKWDHFALKTKIETADDGEYNLIALNGETLTATLVEDDIFITDALGNMASITAMDLKQNNGIVHVIDTVLKPQVNL